MPHATPINGHTRVADVLADILTDAHRQTPAQIAEFIRDADWYGAGTDEDSAVGNFLAVHLVLAKVAPAVAVWVQYHTVTVLDGLSNELLARGEMSGGLAELRDLIVQGDEEFADLDRADDVEATRLGVADHAEAFASGPMWRENVAV